MPTKAYLEYIQSSAWRQKSDLVKKESRWRCYVCGRDWQGKGRRLECHHLSYERLTRERRSDLVCLCNKHHPVGRASMDTLRLMRLLYLLKKLLLLPLRLAWRLVRGIVAALLPSARNSKKQAP